MCGYLFSERKERVGAKQKDEVWGLEGVGYALSLTCPLHSHNKGLNLTHSSTNTYIQRYTKHTQKKKENKSKKETNPKGHKHIGFFCLLLLCFLSNCLCLLFLLLPLLRTANGGGIVH